MSSSLTTTIEQQNRPGEGMFTGTDAKRSDIQGLRAVAVIFVVLYHAGLPLPAGFAGVDVFFVISGFVITGQIQRMGERGRFSFSAFYARRVRRLLPAMVVMLLVVVLLSLLFQSPLDAQPATASTALAAVLLVGNLQILGTSGDYFAAAAETNPLLHVWSLSVEEQFYLVFPLLLVAVGKLAGARRRILALCLISLISAASFALSVWWSFVDGRIGGHPAADLAFYTAPTRVWEFGAGAVLALWVTSRRTAHPRPSRWAPTGLGAAGLVTLLVLHLTVDRTTPWPGTAALLPVLATVLLILAGTIGRNRITRLLASTPLRVTGDLSYSIYLWHWPMIVFAAVLWPDPPPTVTLVAVLVSLLLAVLSYRYVEQPLRHGRFALPRVYLGGAVSAAVVVLIAVTAPAAGAQGIPDAAGYAQQRDLPTYGREKNCLIHDRAYDAAELTRCTDVVPADRGWVMLAGDSHADALSTGLIEADRRLGLSTQYATGASCVFSRTAAANHEFDCAAMASDQLDRAVSGDDPPSLVVVSSWALHRYRNDQTWPEPLRPALEELTQAGVPVLYVMDVPSFATEAMHEQGVCRGGLATWTCGRSQSGVLSYQAAARDAEFATVSSIPGVAVYDPWSRFCDGTTCSPLVDGQLAYYDYNHLNRIGSASLGADLESAIAGILKP
ncbi:acyltransferase family protein [Kineosporia sp. NBRC 101731]|uniref:acyltransferase family protein n=1 Tax=Kineosporia sp. NBRC 101731 TaxID=3032199 RepID=UPI0024A3ED8C|nr:acyltransferase family protein [Kineosporia sp. NBRC 101731]GLY30956.1 acyltransferase [Kineosporia sp. NBRC 101731]